MKKSNIIFLSIAAGFLTALIVLISDRYAHSLFLDSFGYFVPPIALCLYLMKGNFWTKKSFLNILISLLIYGVVVYLAELAIFNPWNLLTTPAGNTYTRYGLDAMYPALGIIILILSFAFSLAIRFVAETIIVVSQKLGSGKKQV